MKLNIIVAYCENRGIGIDNKLPWHFKSDLNKFKTLTIGNKNNAIIMGKNTWESIGKPLPYRDNLILSKSLSKNIKQENVHVFDSLEKLENFYISKNYDDIWIIGGSQIYKTFMNKNVDYIYITYINKTYNCDTFFPEIDNNKYILLSKSIHTNLITNTITNNTNNNNNNNNNKNTNKNTNTNTNANTSYTNTSTNSYTNTSTNSINNSNINSISNTNDILFDIIYTLHNSYIS